MVREARPAWPLRLTNRAPAAKPVAAIAACKKSSRPLDRCTKKKARRSRRPSQRRNKSTSRSRTRPRRAQQTTAGRSFSVRFFFPRWCRVTRRRTDVPRTLPREKINLLGTRNGTRPSRRTARGVSRGSSFWRRMLLERRSRRAPEAFSATGGGRRWRRDGHFPFELPPQPRPHHCLSSHFV